MTMSERLCLKWNEFQENIHQTFGGLRNTQEFADVTLVCEDGQQMEAHRVVLASSSPFFQKMMERLNHPHPLIYMRGLTPEDLAAMLDFIYFGEANVTEEKVENFLLIADDLQIKGLTNHAENYDHNQVDQKSLTIKKPQENHVVTNHRDDKTNCSNIKLEGTTNLFENIENKRDNYVHIQGLDDKIRSLMTKSEKVIRNGGFPRKAYTCKVCGKEGKGSNIKSHIENNHIEGLSIPCNFCDETCKSRSSLDWHIHRAHK